MSIKEYYQNNFRQDLSCFMPDSKLPYFGHSWDYDCKGLEKILETNRAAFLICLYFTVLVDQGMYTHYRQYYAIFESLTRYPKFCHGLGQFQKNPRGILLIPVERNMVKKNEIESVLSEGMALFIDEVVDFCINHMPEIKAKDFFEKILYDSDVQIPLIVTMANPTLRH